MGHGKKRASRWSTFSALKQEALKYKKRKDFVEFSSGAFQAAYKRDDYEEIVSHMPPPLNEAYTRQEIEKEVLKYSRYSDFRKNGSRFYRAAIKRSDFGEICSPLIHDAFWTKEELKKESIKYKSRKEFEKKNPAAFQAAWKSNDYEEIVSHMKIYGGASGAEKYLLDRIKDIHPTAKSIKDMSVLYPTSPIFMGSE